MKTILWKKKHTIAVLTAFIAMFLPLKGYAEIVAYGLAIAGNKVTSATTLLTKCLRCKMPL